MSLIFCLALVGCQSLAIPDFNWRRTHPATPAAIPAASANIPASQSLPPPVPAASARFAFAPLSGAPPSIANQLATAIARHSATRNLQLTGADDPAATYLVKGYLSTVPDGRTIQLVYVWDVLGPDRRRLHRISGWTHVTPMKNNPWGGVGPAAIDTVASASLDALAIWIGAS